MSETLQSPPSAWLVGDGAGAMAPGHVPAALQAGPGSTANARPSTLWLDATQGLTLLADGGARFADAQALTTWARRVWAHYGADEGAAAAAPAVSPWRSRSRRAASMTTADVAGWRAAAAQAGHAVVCVAPLWSGALALASRRLTALQRQGRVLVVEGQALTVIDIADGAIHQWQLTWLDRPDAAALWPWVESAPAGPVAALGHSLAGTPPVSLRVQGALDGAAQDFVSQLAPVAAPSFVPARPLAARWTWAGVATVAMVLAVSAWDAAQAWQERESAQAALVAQRAAALEGARLVQQPTALANDRAQGAAAATGRGVPPRSATAGGRSPAADAARLAAPWRERFLVAESALPAGGHWLRVEQPAGSGPMRLGGTVPTPTDAFQVAQRIAAEPGVLDVTVLRTEAAGAEAAPGLARTGLQGHEVQAPRTRFELSVAWAAGGPP